MASIKWTFEALKESASKYGDVKTWRTKEPSAYATASQKKLLPQLTAQMKKSIIHNYWTEERVIERSKDFEIYMALGEPVLST